MKKIIIKLENRRKKLNKKIAHQGNLYDYLDRGLPDDKQKTSTWKSIESLKIDIEKLENEMDAYVKKIRNDNMDAIDLWINLQIKVCNKIIETTEINDRNSTSFESVRIHVAENIKKSWQNLNFSSSYTVLINNYYCSDYDTIMNQYISEL